MQIQFLIAYIECSPRFFFLQIAVALAFSWLYLCNGSEGAFSFDNPLVRDFATYNLFLKWDDGAQWVESFEKNYESLLMLIFVSGLIFFLGVLRNTRTFSFSTKILFQVVFTSAVLAAIVSFEMKHFNAMMDWVAGVEAQGGFVCFACAHPTIDGVWYVKWPLLAGIWCSIFGLVSLLSRGLSWLPRFGDGETGENENEPSDEVSVPQDSALRR